MAFSPDDPDVLYTIGKDRDLAVYDGKKWRSLGLKKMAVDPNGPVNFPRTIAIDPRYPAIIGEVFKGGPDGIYVYPPPYKSNLRIYNKCIPLKSKDRRSRKR